MTVQESSDLRQKIAEERANKIMPLMPISRDLFIASLRAAMAEYGVELARDAQAKAISLLGGGK